MLASRPALYSVHFQYPATLLPFAFALTPIALAQLAETRGVHGRRLGHALVVAALGASLLVSWKHGAILDNDTFRGGFRTVARTLSAEQLDAYRFVREQANGIPGVAAVAASNRIGPHISNRRKAYLFPEQFQDLGHPVVDCYFVDEGELAQGDLKHFKELIREGGFIEVGRHKKLAIYKRPPT
jgi:uncharacterized membrane protein